MDSALDMWDMRISPTVHLRRKSISEMAYFRLSNFCQPHCAPLLRVDVSKGAILRSESTDCQIHARVLLVESTRWPTLWRRAERF